MRARQLVPMAFLLSLVSVGATAQEIYRLTDIGALNSTNTSYGIAMNDSGQVAGDFPLTGVASNGAFLWNGISLQDLGTLGGWMSSARAINDSGQVAGFSDSEFNSHGGYPHAFLWNGTTLQDLGTFGGTYSIGVDINDSGQVTGEAWTGERCTTGCNAVTHAFLWTGTTLQDLGTLGGEESTGRAINSSGNVTGYSKLSDGIATRAFLWNGTTMQDLGTLGGRDSAGHAINDSGQVTGSSSVTGDTETHAFLWDGAAMQDLGTLGGTYSQGVEINASGQVVGLSYTSGDEALHAFFWNGTTVVDLGTLGGTEAIVSAINDSGQVTGYSYMTGDNEVHAFLWDGTAMQDLNSLIDPTDPLQPFVTLESGIDINDLGQILASGRDSRTGSSHAYLVSPPPSEPFTISPSGLAFPAQAIGVASSSQAVVLTNNTGAALPITSITRTGANPNQFSQTNDCGSTVAAAASCSINVIFRPTTVGTKTASLNVNAGGGAGTKTVALSGTGTVAAYTLTPPPETLNFGDQAVNVSSVPRAVTLTNTGSVAMPITNISDTGTNANQFTETHNCGSSVPPSASCAIEVVFRPTTAGVKVASVRVNAGGGAGVQTVDVSGTGIVPTYTLDPASLTFPDQAVSLTSAALAITLTNTSTLALPITGISRTGANANQFAQTSDCGTSVAAGASCTISATFRPTTAGAKVASLRVNGGAGAGAQTVPLTGTGVVPTYSVAPASIAFGAQPRNTSSASRTVTVSNTGSVQLPIASVTLSGANAGQFIRTSGCVSPLAAGANCTIDVVFRPTSLGAKAANLNVNAGGGGGTQTVSLSGTGT